MPEICVRHPYWHLASVAALALAIPAAYAAPKHNPAGDTRGNTACASLGIYVFVGGTGGFDGLESGATELPSAFSSSTGFKVRR